MDRVPVGFIERRREKKEMVEPGGNAENFATPRDDLYLILGESHERV